MKRAAIWAASSLLIPLFVAGYIVFFALVSVASIASAPIDAICQWRDSTADFAKSREGRRGKPAEGVPGPGPED